METKRQEELVNTGDDVESLKTLREEYLKQRPRARGRPRKSESSKRVLSSMQTRVPVSGNRNVLTVQGMDPNFSYRWVLDASEGGHRILRFKMAGYSFAPAGDHVTGDLAVYRSAGLGSIIREPAGDGVSYLYLMRLPKSFYEHDQLVKQQRVDEAEDAMRAGVKDDGHYGEVKITRKLARETPSE